MEKSINDKIGKVIEWLDVAVLSSGSALRLPLHKILGNKDGPTLGIIATSHGDEPLGIEILRRFVNQIDPYSLKGSIFVVPVQNPPAFESSTRNTPLDMLNMNRCFPGEYEGFLTQKLAWVISQKVFPNIDYLIDLHAGTADFTVDYTYIINDENLAMAFGSEGLIRGVVIPGSAGAYAAEKNIGAIASEVGGGLGRDEEFIAKGLKGLYNVIKFLNMIEGNIDINKPQYIFDEVKIIFSNFGGLICPKVTIYDTGKIVERDEVLGTIFSPFDFSILEQIKAPYKRSYLLMLKGVISRIKAGDFAYMVGNMDKCHKV